MHPGHVDHEREEVVDEGVQSAVHERAPRKVLHGLVLVVEEELRGHHHEAHSVHAVDPRLEQPRVPALVLLVDEREDRVAEDGRREAVEQVAGREAVDLLAHPLRFHGGFNLFALLGRWWRALVPCSGRTCSAHHAPGAQQLPTVNHDRPCARRGMRCGMRAKGHETQHESKLKQ